MAAPISLLTDKARQSKFWNEVTECMPRANIDALHLRKLWMLVYHVYQHSPFYRRRFDEIDLKPDDIRSIEDFKRKVPHRKLQRQALGKDLYMSLDWQTGQGDLPDDILGKLNGAILERVSSCNLRRYDIRPSAMEAT